MRCTAVRDLFDADFPCWRTTINGGRVNRDICLGSGLDLPAFTPNSVR
jgi:hypothetical protein